MYFFYIYSFIHSYYINNNNVSNKAPVIFLQREIVTLWESSLVSDFPECTLLVGGLGHRHL